MVKMNPVTTPRPREGSMLRRKLWRDMRRSAMQFMAIVLLCALGTWVFSGLDGAWRMIQLSFDTYFEECRLADLWVNAASISKNDLHSLSAIEGVDTVQARFSAELDCPELGDDVSLKVHAFDGAPQMNLPHLQSGALLAAGDRRGILLEQQFADAHGLGVGDSIKLDVAGRSMTFLVRGLVVSAEDLVLTKDVSPNPAAYSFAVIDWQAVRFLPFNEAILTVKPDADTDAVASAIQKLLPEALLLDHHSQASAQRADSEVGIFRNLSYVFPAMAYGVAAMVVLSTLTRMIENQRTQMGCLKALGYNDRKIRGHYLNYALVPSIFGALAGLIVGRYTLPDMLYDMEAAHYIMPYRLRAPISPLAWFVTALMVALSVLICLYTYRRAAKENTASLLRPKPPKAGARILLERWHGLWSRLSFNTKMMIRNIARNKGRTLMSMLGLLCCNMLIICAMGLQDSIDQNIGDYYKRTLAYELRADLTQEGGTLESWRNRLDAAEVEGLMEQSVSIRTASVSRTVLLTVTEDQQTMLHLGEEQALTPLPTDGITLSRKLAETLNISVGDQVAVWLPSDDQPLSLRVSMISPEGIGQNAYLTRSHWESLHKGAFVPTALLLRQPTEECLHQLSESDAVSATKNPVTLYDNAMTMMDSTKAVFSLMYGAALGLAFVICYNMGLMNFTERTRDYATLKVLGYHQREIRRLMMRENNLVTVIGALLGVVPGLLLTEVVLSTVASETMVWTAKVAPLSVLLATIITCAFSMFLELMITRKVPGIDMVEALKSVE